MIGKAVDRYMGGRRDMFDTIKGGIVGKRVVSEEEKNEKEWEVDTGEEPVGEEEYSEAI